MRLNKYLAAAGVASRRKCDDLIKSGQIKLNGESGDFTGVQVDPEKDKVMYKGKIIKLPEQKIYIMLNKPSGYVCTCSDDKGRETVLELLKGFDTRLFPVGRLDYDTEGLLIITNDGELANHVTHPRHEIEKKYFVRVSGVLTDEKMDLLENGILLDGKRTAKSKVSVLKETEKAAELTITIHEGRNRQVRRMLEALGLEVQYLRRINIGMLSLKGLKTGEYRALEQNEIDYLYNL